MSNTKKQGNTIVPTGIRNFTGNFDVLLNHNNQDPKVRYAKRMAQKQLKAYLAGHERYSVQSRTIQGLVTNYFPVPQTWR